VPRTIDSADSKLMVFKSGILVLAISVTCAGVILPTFLRLGSPEAVSIFAAAFIIDGTGGVFVMKVKLLSAYTVIITGII